MRKAFASFAIALSAVVSVSGTAAPAFAQEAPVVVPPPPINIVASPPADPRITNREFFADFDAAVIEGFAVCRDAARQHRDFIPGAYADLQWSVHNMGPATNVEGNPYDSIELKHFPDIRLDIRQYQNYAECSVMTLVLDMDHAAHLQRLFEEGSDALLFEEGPLKDEVLASENRSWGDSIDVRHYDLFFGEEFVFAARHMVVSGTPVFLLETTPIEHVNLNMIRSQREGD